MRATIHTIEAVIGTLILLVGVMSFYPMEQRTDFYFSDDGYACLKYMDDAGVLRNYVYNSMTDELNSTLRECLPQIIDYTFKICATTTCTTDLPADKSVFLSSYLLSGDKTYDKKIINLWLWSK